MIREIQMKHTRLLGAYLGIRWRIHKLCKVLNIKIHGYYIDGVWNVTDHVFIECDDIQLKRLMGVL